jgi:hypothetical protein
MLEHRLPRLVQRTPVAGEHHTLAEAQAPS